MVVFLSPLPHVLPQHLRPGNLSSISLPPPPPSLWMVFVLHPSEELLPLLPSPSPKPAGMFAGFHGDQFVDRVRWGLPAPSVLLVVMNLYPTIRPMVYRLQAGHLVPELPVHTPAFTSTNMGRK